jgi:hypothetical protein
MSTKEKTFQAYAKGKTSTYGASPREAAEKFFIANPTARKCDVLEGETEYTSGVPFFVVKYGNSHTGEWPQSFKDVTKKTAGTLVDAKAKKPEETPDQKS